MTFPVTFDIVDATQSLFTSTAEIAAFDNDADASNGSTAIDIDSTPDADNSDPVVDQTEPGDPANPTPGDEDDHDIAVFELVVRIGNKVWIDANDDGLQGESEAPVPGVVVNLLDADGEPVLGADRTPITTTTDENLSLIHI